MRSATSSKPAGVQGLGEGSGELAQEMQRARRHASARLWKWASKLPTGYYLRGFRPVGTKLRIEKGIPSI